CQCQQVRNRGERATALVEAGLIDRLVGRIVDTDGRDDCFPDNAQIFLCKAGGARRSEGLIQVCDMVCQPLYSRGLACTGFTPASSMRENWRRKNLDRIVGDGAESQKSFQTSERVCRTVCEIRTYGAKELTGTTADRVDVVAIVIVELLLRN